MRCSSRTRLLAMAFFSLLLLFGSLSAFADEVGIYNLAAQSILSDPNPFRYSPLNMIDADPSTVFAFHRLSVDSSKPFLRVLFSAAVTLTRLGITPGYFDDRLFARNDRIIGLRIVTKDRSKGPVAETRTTFEDKMEPQQVLFKGPTECTEMELYVESFAKGSSWDDICISELTFFSNEAELKPTIKLQGNSTLADSFWDYTYDQNNRLTSTHAQYGKAGDETDYYAYNPEGVVAFVLNREMGDYLNDAYTNYFYDEKKPKQLLKTVRLDRKGQVTEAQQYAYDSQGRLTAVRIGGTRNGSIAYKYKANQQVEKETSITNAGASKSYEKILTYYEKGIPIGESLTRDTESMLFQYIQQGSSLLKVPVSDIETRWWAEYAISSNGQLRSRTTFDHQRAWGYPGD